MESKEDVNGVDENLIDSLRDLKIVRNSNKLRMHYCCFTPYPHLQLIPSHKRSWANVKYSREKFIT